MAGYGDDNGFGVWLADNGYVLPAGTPALAVLRERGADYIDATYGARFTGHVADPVAQVRQWPRQDAWVRDVAIPEDSVPPAVIAASYHAAWFEANTPGGLIRGGCTSGNVQREKVDVIEVEYQVVTLATPADAVALMTPVISIVEGLLTPYLRGAFYDPNPLVV